MIFQVYTMLYYILFLGCFGVADLVFVEQERDMTVTINNNNSLRQLGSQFDILVTISNTGKLLKENVMLKYINSRHVSLDAVNINDVSSKLTDGGPVLITKQLQRNEAAEVSFRISIVNGADVTSGYHIDNIVFNFGWVSDSLEFNTIHYTIIIPFVVPGCNTTFDISNGGLRADQVTATSYYTTSSPQNFDENSSGWCAKENKNQYMEILFTKRARITSIYTLSRTDKEYWIREYQISYMFDGKWFDYPENEFVKNFTGYKNKEDNVFPWLVNGLECDGIRFRPTKHEGDLICTRLAIQGCYVESTVDTCMNPLGMENGAILNASLSDLVPSGDKTNSMPAYARLNAKTRWIGSTLNQDWLQIDMGFLYKVTRIAIQSDYQRSDHITKFNLWYGNDTLSWKSITVETGTLSTIFAPVSNDQTWLISLPELIIGRSFRIEPTEFGLMKVMRTELYGCPIKDLSQEEIEGEIKEIYPRTILVDNIGGRIFICQRNSKKSSCFYVEEKNSFRHWKALPKHILNIVAMDKLFNSYAITKQGGYAIQRSDSDIWMDISLENMMEREKNDSIVQRVTEIPKIFPNIESNRYKWSFKSEREVSVSGRGLHLRETKQSPWKLVASWACCGL